jgi:hypothetical protein
MPLNWHVPNIKNHLARLISEPDYSYDVHEGGVKRPDGTLTPARPFMDAAVADTDLPRTFAESFTANDLDLNSAIGSAFRQTAEQLYEQIKFEILDEKWEWDRATVRSDGSVATSPRDIYDTGNLLRGQTLEVDS